jgi:uncharacterized LabA/DUF88 family protein
MSAAWFVDGQYLFKAWNSLGRPHGLDYARLRRYLEEHYCNNKDEEKIGDAYYFDANPEPPSAALDSFHAFLQYPPPRGPGLRVKLYWLQKRGLSWPPHMGGGPVLHPTTGEQYESTQQKAVDVGFATHLMRSFANQEWNKVFIATGDADFYEPIQHLVENKNVTLYLIGTSKSISGELQPYAKAIIEIDKIADQICQTMTR